jgi:hypothetical protein
MVEKYPFPLLLHTKKNTMIKKTELGFLSCGLGDFGEFFRVFEKIAISGFEKIGLLKKS